MTTTLDHLPTLRLRPLEQPHPSSRWSSGGRNGDRRDRAHLALSELFTSRHDLDGVSVVADVLAEDLLWSA